jgi:phage I-like protein
VAMSDDELCHVSVPLADIGRAGDDAGPVWIQIAKTGHFEGHPAGPFDLTTDVFAEIVRNFDAVDNSEVAIDFCHASECEPCDGSIPTLGAPAQGLIKQLENRGDAGLWALVEWFEPAKTYIREGKYRHVSPAIRFNARHPETGKRIGARLTSVALTTRPFLRGMQPVRASDTQVLHAVGALVVAAAERCNRSGADGDRDAPPARERTSMMDTQVKDLEAKNADLTTRLSDAEARRAGFEAKVAELSLRLNDVEAKRSALEAENKLLRDWKTEREEGDLKAEVDTAFATYKDSHRLSDQQRDSMLVLARADMDAFRRLYPPVAPQQRHLLRDLSGGRVADPLAREEKPTLRALTDKLVREQRLSFEEAQIAASRELGIRQLVAR